MDHPKWAKNEEEKMHWEKKGKKKWNNCRTHSEYKGRGVEKMKQRNSRIQAASQQYQQTNESKCIQGKRRRTTTAIHIISQERMKNEEEEETKRSSCQTSNRHTNISQNDTQQTSSPKLAWFCSFFESVVYIFLYFCCNSFF